MVLFHNFSLRCQPLPDGLPSGRLWVQTSAGPTTRGQFNKTFTRVIYKCSYCSQTLKQWLHLQITRVKVLLN